MADALQVQTAVPLLQLPAGSVLVRGAVEPPPGLEAGEAGLVAGCQPAVERRKRPVQAGQRAPGDCHPVTHEVGPCLVEVLQLGELVEPLHADAPLEGLPALLEGGVVGLALHRQQVPEGTALPGRGMQDVLVRSEHVFDDTPRY